MKKLMQKCRKGATFIEYAMLAGLVAIVVATAVLLFGDKIKNVFKTTTDKTEQVNEGIKDADLKPTLEQKQ